VPTGIVFTGVGVGILFAGTLVPTLLETNIKLAWTGLALIGAAGLGIAFWGLNTVEDDAVTPLSGLFRPAKSRLVWTPDVFRLVAIQTLFSIGHKILL
jgi:hypothetical protein